MQIIAESRPATFVPYIHLGYLAASTLKPHSGLLNAGIVLLVAGVAMTTRLAKGKSRRGRAETYVKFRRGRMATYGIPLVLVGTLLLYGSRKFGRHYYRHAGRMTQIRMREVYHAVYMTQHADKETANELLYGARVSVPESPGEYVLGPIYIVRDKGAASDGWNTPMKLKADRTAEGTQYTILSAGPDATWNTEDDLSSAPREAQWKEEFDWELERFREKQS